MVSRHALRKGAKRTGADVPAVARPLRLRLRRSAFWPHHPVEAGVYLNGKCRGEMRQTRAMSAPPDRHAGPAGRAGRDALARHRPRARPADGARDAPVADRAAPGRAAGPRRGRRGRSSTTSACSPGSAVTSTPTSRRSGSATTWRSRPTPATWTWPACARGRSCCSHVGAGRGWLERARLGVAFLGDGRRAASEMIENHWLATNDLAAAPGPGRRGARRASTRRSSAGTARGCRRRPRASEILVAGAAGEPRRRGRGLPPRPGASRRRSRSPGSAAAPSSTRRWWTSSAPRRPTLFGDLDAVTTLARR